jgi:hypothetical protein
MLWNVEVKGHFCLGPLRPTPNSENQMMLLQSVDTPISPRKKSPNKEINKPNYSFYFEQQQQLGRIP